MQLEGDDILTALNAVLNTLQVCFLGYLAAKYQSGPTDERLAKVKVSEPHKRSRSKTKGGCRPTERRLVRIFRQIARVSAAFRS